MRLKHLPDHQPSTSARRKLSLAVILPLSVGLVVSGPLPAALAEPSFPVVQTQVVQPAPEADLLDVDFSDGTAADTAQNLPLTEHGNPQIELDPALERNAVTFDGESALQYPFGD